MQILIYGYITIQCQYMLEKSHFNINPIQILKYLLVDNLELSRLPKDLRIE